MTVSSIEPVNNYTGNSSNKKFDFDFLIEDETELVVQYTDSNGVITLLQEGVDYSINEVGNQNGSYITFPIQGSNYDVLKSTEKLSLMLSLVIKQEKELRNSLFFNFDTLEWMFDYIVRVLQVLNRRIMRCVKVDEGSSQSADELISALNQAQINAAESANNAANSAQSALTSETNAGVIYGNASNLYTTMQSLEQSAVNEINNGRENIASDLTAALTAINNRAEELAEQYFDKADSSLLQLNSQGNAKLLYSPFSINTGVVLNGENATLTYSNAELTCKPCTITTADNRTKSFNANSVLDCSSVSDGTYKVMKSYTNGALSLCSNISISKTSPASPANGDLWLDNSMYPLSLKEYNSSNSEWIENNDLVQIGELTAANGVISAIKNDEFNKYNEFKLYPYIIERYQNNTSGYEIYSDGFCRQWGVVASGSINNGTITFIKKFKDTKYTIVGNCGMSMTNGYNVFCLYTKAAGSVKWYKSNSNIAGDWLAIGYLAQGEY